MNPMLRLKCLDVTSFCMQQENLVSCSHNLKSKNLKAFVFQFFSTFYLLQCTNFTVKINQNIILNIFGNHFNFFKTDTFKQSCQSVLSFLCRCICINELTINVFLNLKSKANNLVEYKKMCMVVCYSSSFIKPFFIFLVRFSCNPQTMHYDLE